MSYKHLTQENIIAIEIYLKEWFNYSYIAKILNKSHSTISRLVKKYTNPYTKIFEHWYCIRQRTYVKNNTNKLIRERVKDDDLDIKCAKNNLKSFILKRIKKYRSPEQIAWRWKENTWEKISKDTIYKFIYEKHPELIKKYLRRKWKKYQHKRKEKYQIKDRRMIEFRPYEVELRERIWDWEWDTVIWLRWWNKEVILTNVERKSWYLLASKIKDKSWNSVLKWTQKLFKNIPKYKKKTMTYDNWREFSKHKKIEETTNLTVYFAHPYSSWERWSNENTNWLLRQFMPKKTDFESVSENKLKFYIGLINSRPRKRLNWKTPNEVFFGK